MLSQGLVHAVHRGARVRQFGTCVTTAVDQSGFTCVVTLLMYCDYMDVGIRELKAHLSEYVERASRGEVVRVTDRGVPRAVLMALPDPGALDRGLAEGWILRAEVEGPAQVTPVQAPPGPTTTQVLAEDRGA